MALPEVVVRVLDGEDTIGGSKILLGTNGSGVLLDFGINYTRWGHYFEEYVKPRTAYGLADLWKLNLVPRIEGLYRPDVVPPGLRGDALPVKDIQGVFVSHAHLDHAGLIGLLHPNIPMVCSRMTAAILKGVQDSGKSDIFAQSVYSSPYRAATVARQEVYRSDEDAPYRGRDCFLVDGVGAEPFHRFWQAPPSRSDSDAARKGRKSKSLEPGRLERHQGSEAGAAAEAFVVDHSVLGSSGFVLETTNGTIAYSGDLRASGEHAQDSLSFLNHLKHHPPFVLLMEGTQVRAKPVDEEAFGGRQTEEEVEANCLRAVERFHGQAVIADFAPRNIERLKAFQRIARKTGRALVILPRDAYLLDSMNTADSTVPAPAGDMIIFDPPSGKVPDGWERHVLDRYAGHVITAGEIRARLAELILCFSYWDVKHLLDVEPPSGAYIFSGSEAHSEEQEMDMERLYHWLTRFNLTPVGFQMRPIEGKRRRFTPFFDRGFHASGHMGGEDILDWVFQIRPEYVLPVHTEHSDRFAQRLDGTGIKVLKGGIER